MFYIDLVCWHCGSGLPLSLGPTVDTFGCITSWFYSGSLPIPGIYSFCLLWELKISFLMGEALCIDLFCWWCCCGQPLSLGPKVETSGWILSWFNSESIPIPCFVHFFLLPRVTIHFLMREGCMDLCYRRCGGSLLNLDAVEELNSGKAVYLNFLLTVFLGC